MADNLPPSPAPGTGPRATTASASVPAPSTLGACPSIDSVVNNYFQTARPSVAADPNPTLPPPVHVVRHDSGGTSSAAAAASVPRHPTLPSAGPDRSFPTSPMRAGTLPPRPVLPLRADSTGGKSVVVSAIPRAMTAAAGTAPRAMPRTGHDTASRSDQTTGVEERLWPTPASVVPALLVRARRRAARLDQPRRLCACAGTGPSRAPRRT
ncbi:hypothetical protein AMAG_19574 [Allomyces macrogynus ATCC 38327]|uniref:Uncharacterized protein n=1 Tax=Allomyces macrogynus (strain ATCC 38327) TaxID=578462 RepID=A0A0L0SVM7_ALLM3|nr:hypothetical protein AMAG_19574 [Allomyces macrogynus ATCC 38327]|eukprot:KNE66399.1 hypothetical protein AMAG_19574 [Allomyces macrogynus ATCC 38327]